VKHQRKKIARQLREVVRDRQKRRCACCLECASLQLHHIDPVFLNGKDSVNNLIFLCRDCHRLLHLADPTICMQVYEYAYFLNYRDLPEDPYSLLSAEKVLELFRQKDI